MHHAAIDKKLQAVISVILILIKGIQMIRYKIGDVRFIPPHILAALYSNKKRKHRRVAASLSPYGSMEAIESKNNAVVYAPYYPDTNFYKQLTGLEKLFNKPIFNSGTCL